LADNPHSQVFAALAEAYRRRGDFGRAFSVCKNGLKHHPDYALGHIVMAKLFLHQRMSEEALASLQRAIEIDGPTRTTDLLEAELHLMRRNAAAAQIVIDRLRSAQPNNPSVDELNQRLRELRTSIQLESQETDDVDEPVEIRRYAPAPRPTVSQVVNWTEWAAAIGQMRGVAGAVAFDASGQTLASHATDETTHAGMETVGTLFNEIDAHLRRAEWGALEEIRIELPHREVWGGRVNDSVLGVMGGLQGAFGEVRRRALETAAQVNTTDPENHGDPTEDGHTELSPAASADETSQDE